MGRVASRAMQDPAWLIARLQREWRTPTFGAIRVLRRSLLRSAKLQADGHQSVLAVYVVRPSSAGYDLCNFLGSAHNFSNSLGGLPIDVLLLVEDSRLWLYEGGGTQASASVEWRLWNLLVPLASRAALVRDVFVSDVGANWSAHLDDHVVYPPMSQPGYLAEWNVPESPYLWRRSYPSCFRASDEAISMVAKWKLAVGVSDPFVCVTLRNRDVDPLRNSRAANWVAFGRQIRAEGFETVFVPDTGSLWSEDEVGTEFFINREAALNVDIRLALYEMAYCSFFYSNGPSALAALDSHIRSVMLCPVFEQSNFSDLQSYASQELHPGMNQLAPDRNHLLLHWSTDEADEILRAFREFQNRDRHLDSS